MKARARFLLLTGIAALLPCLLTAQDANPPKLVPALGWDVAKQGGFVTAVAADAQNNVWAGTEGGGCGVTIRARKIGRNSPRRMASATIAFTRSRWTSSGASGPATSTTA